MFNNKQHHLDKIREQLDDGEIMQHAIYGTFDVEPFNTGKQKKGTMVATNQRLIFYTDSLTGTKMKMRMYKYSSISNFAKSKDMWIHTMSFAIHEHQLKMSCINSAMAKEFFDYLENQVFHRGEVKAKPAVPANEPKQSKSAKQPKQEDIISIKLREASKKAELLEKLDDFRKRGVITEEEFIEKKKRLLDL